MKLLKTSLIYIAAGVLCGLIGIATARAHSWYPEDCCSDYDCEPIPMEAVVETEYGWHVEYRSKKLGYINVDVPETSHRVKPNEHDGQYHGCFGLHYRPYADEYRGTQPRYLLCFWYPLWS
jgi:hypothetical protein